MLRAGLGMLDAVLELVPSARVGHIGLQRDEATAVASRYYSQLPPTSAPSYVLMVDPMLATGGSGGRDRSDQGGRRAEHPLICIVAAPEGVALLKARIRTSTSTRRWSIASSTRTSSSCLASATSATGLYGT